MSFFLQVELDVPDASESIHDRYVRLLQEALQAEGIGRVLEQDSDSEVGDMIALGTLKFTLEVEDLNRARNVIDRVLRCPDGEEPTQAD